MKPLKVSAYLLMLCLTFAVFTSAQKPDKPESSAIDIRVNLQINDPSPESSPLTATDIKLFEDGIEQKVQAVSQKKTKLNLGLIIDASGSMRSDLGSILAFVDQLIAHFEPDDEAFIVRSINSDNTTIWHDWSADKKTLSRSVDTIGVEPGPSAVMNGLNFATDHLLERAKADNSQRYALILISDCEERINSPRETDVLAKLRASGIQVFVVALTENLDNGPRYADEDGKSKAEHRANRIAFNTGGAAYITSADKLSTVVNALFSELRSQYVIDYASTNTKRSDDKRRKLRVEIMPGEKNEKRSGRVRDFLLVPKNK